MDAANTDLTSASSATHGSLRCPLCQEVFINPKILPCFHTFCQACLQHLVGERTADRFPCPTCRQEIVVPSGGVSAFRKNSYIQADDLEKARNNMTCANHPKKPIEVYCAQCCALICVACWVSEHKHHDTEVVTTARHKLRTQLEEAKPRLSHYVNRAKSRAEEAEKEVSAVKEKKTAVKDVIHKRHATLQAVIDRYRDEALASLDTVTEDILTVQEVMITSQHGVVEELTKLQQRVQHALDSDNISELVTVAREMICGRGRQNAVQKLTTQQVTICRPVLRFSATPDATLQRMHDYMGSAARMEMAVSAPEVTVVEQFRCREDPDTDVCHVCPMTDDSVWVSYEPYMLRNDASAEKHSADGRVSRSKKYVRSVRLTMTRRKNGKSMYSRPTEGSHCISSYPKKCSVDLNKVLVLENELTGQANVLSLSIVSEDPLKTEATAVFTLHCAAHRAFDVDASEQLFVVLEEGKTPDWQRRVQLYRRPQMHPIATYSPPVAPFQPSDVCFYTLGGHEVLLVADELNDAIHVVNLERKLSKVFFTVKETFYELVFLRYLSPGCPLLVQPTALNTDMRGRLWVACRGGRILTFTPHSTARENC